MKTSYHYLSSLCTLFLIGCSTSTAIYDNPSIKNKVEKNNRFEQDQFQCELQSYRLVPPAYTKPNYKYTPKNSRRGSFTIRNQSTGVTSVGSYTSKSNNSYMTGFNNATNRLESARESARVSRMYHLRNKAYYMCLKERGWRKISK